MSRRALDQLQAVATASKPVQMAATAPVDRGLNAENTTYSTIPPLLFAPGELIMKPVQAVTTASFSADEAAKVSENLDAVASRAIAQTGIDAQTTKIDEGSGEIVVTLDAALKAAAADE